MKNILLLLLLIFSYSAFGDAPNTVIKGKTLLESVKISATPVTLTSLSETNIEVTCITGTGIVTLPNTSTLVAGRTFSFTTKTCDSIEVKNFSGTSLTTIYKHSSAKYIFDGVIWTKYVSNPSINGDGISEHTITVSKTGTTLTIANDGAGSHDIRIPDASATASEGLITNGTQTIGGNKSFDDSIALTATTVSTSGQINDASTSGGSFYRFTDASIITGFANGTNGKILVVANVNATTQLTLKNENIDSVATNRIITGTEIDLVIDPNASVQLIYDSTTQRWRVFGGSGGGGGEGGFSGAVYPMPTITNNLNGTVNVGSGQIAVYSNANFDGQLQTYNVVGLTNQALSNGVNYIVGDYNAGLPILKVITNVALITESDIVPIYTVAKLGTELHILSWDEMANGLANKLHQRLVKTSRFARESGLDLSSNVSRNVLITSGIAWNGANKTNMNQFTATGELHFYYHVAGVWTQQIVTTWNNTQYDDGTNLVTMTNSKYANVYVFRFLETNEHAAYVMGNNEYNSESLAQGENVPSIPSQISSTAMLVGRITFQKSASTGTIQSAFVTVFAGTTLPSHNDLMNIQGGKSNEYYHNTDREQKRVSRDSTPQPMFDNNAESGSVGTWTGFDDGAVARPIDATGGTATGLTFAASNTSPLMGTYSYLLSKDAANRKGKGLSVSSIVIEEGFRGRQLQYCFSVDSSTANTYGVFVYDQTNSVPLSVQYGELIASGKYDHCAVFSTSLNTALIRVAKYVATTTTTADTLKFDDAFISKTASVYAPRYSDETDLAASTTTTFIGFGTVSGQSLKGTMTGENLSITARFISGTSTATQARINLPYVIGGVETNKRIAGHCNKGIATSTSFVLYATKGNSYLTIGKEGAGAENPQTDSNADNIASSGEEIKCTSYPIPIETWRSGQSITGILNTVPSVPLVYAISNNNEINITGNVTDIVFNEVIDVNNLWDGNEFRPDQDGIYEMCGGINFSSNPNGDVLIFDNASVARSIGTARGAQTKFCGTMLMLKGRAYSLRHDGGLVNLSSTNGQFYHHLTITRKGNPSVVSVPEKIIEKWAATSGTFTAETTLTTFTNKVVSTHGLFTPANGRFTANRSGFVNAHIRFRNSAAITYAVGDVITINLKKNGTLFEQLLYRVPLTTYQTQHRDMLVKNIPVGSGDYLEFSMASTAAHAVSANLYDNVQTFSMEE